MYSIGDMYGVLYDSGFMGSGVVMLINDMT